MLSHQDGVLEVGVEWEATKKERNIPLWYAVIRNTFVHVATWN